MASLSDINILKEGNHNWVELNHFMSFLRKHSQPSDVPLRRSNIIKQSKRLENGLLEELNMKLNFMAVLKFIISHSDTMSVCKTLAKEIESKVLEKQKQRVLSRETQTVVSLLDEIVPQSLPIRKKSSSNEEALELDSRGQYLTFIIH